MKQRIRKLLEETVHRCIELGALIEAPIPEYVVEVPNHPDHGHFATNLPLTLASHQKRRPLDIAAIIVDHLEDQKGFLEAVDVAAPGFINFRIKPQDWYQELLEILRLQADYGRSRMGGEERVLVEFVSANPTGPLHLGHGRGAALGDTLCRVMSFCGYEVIREFYINDAGQQIRLLGESIYARWKQVEDPQYPFPENGYHGDYVVELAEAVSNKTDLHPLPEEGAIEVCAQMGREIMLESIRRDLDRFGVSFDVWYSESDIHKSRSLEKDLEIMERDGHLFEREGALWIRTSGFGDDKDRVLRKKDGQFTYFASDISYHLDKHRRGITQAINIWGADHHGYVPRMKAALAAHGIPKQWLSVLLIQLVKLWKGGEEIRMSKRAGFYVALQELIEEVGVDAVRFVFLTKSHDSTLDFDIDLVKRQDSDNPVYYVQYAHARISSIFRKAEAQGVSLPSPASRLLEGLKLEEELLLIRFMTEFPSLLEDIARTLEPHRLTYYLTELAASFHRYFNVGIKNPEHRILTQDKELSQARLLLVESVRIIIATGLGLLGISAPEKM
jgi:arginyl-tRNA synthetase